MRISFLKRLRDIVIEKCMRDASEASYISDKESFEMNLRLFIGGYVSVIEDWAAGSIGMSLKKCTEIMSESIKICIQKYVKKIATPPALCATSPQGETFGSHRGAVSVAD